MSDKKEYGKETPLINESTRFLGKLMGGFKIVIDRKRKIPKGNILVRIKGRPFSYFICPTQIVITRYYKVKIPVLHR